MAARNSRNTYSNYVHRPAEKSASGNRALGGLVLTLLCPPVGLLYLWHGGVFRFRGRVFITALATLEMALLLALVIPKAPSPTVYPTASIPGGVTSAPQSDVANALSNLEALLSDNYSTPEPDQIDDTERALEEAQQKAEQDALLDNTIVYSVYNGARYYHAVQNCGQINNRQMTLREALAAKLGACNICNPPYVS